ncbi:MAG: hypothetical protein K2W92_03185 [Alphaproteobacteria bacterium]|nr:hypothetical protein [Alphaproteobacteria bacterium]
MILKYLKFSTYSFLTLSCFFSTQSVAMLKTQVYSSESFDEFFKVNRPALMLQKRSNSAPVLQNELFEKTSEKIWTLKCRDSFIEATQRVITQDKEWESSLPSFIQYNGELQFPQDFEKIEQWLKIPNIKGFSIIADENKNREFKAVYKWYKQLSKSEVDTRHKLIFMSIDSVLHQKNYVPAPSFSDECLDNHIKYYYYLNNKKAKEI